MTIHVYQSERDVVDSLPMVSRPARVTSIGEMDRDRRDDVRQKLHELNDTLSLDLDNLSAEALDWDTIFDTVAASAPDRIGQIAALHERFERPYPSLISLEFETDRPFDFVAGQFVTVRYQNRARAYSLASSPSSETKELCIRRVPGGKLSPKLCDQLSVGDRITIRGPNGHLLLESPSSRDMAFFATGTGVAPLKSMIEFVFERGWDTVQETPRHIWLFLGAAWADDLPYHDRFSELSATYPHFHYVPCVSRESWLGDWTGETEYIQDGLLKYVDERALADAAFGRHIAQYLQVQPTVAIDARIDPGNLEVYACGLNGMVFSLESTVKRLGVPDGHIHGEGYG